MTPPDVALERVNNWGAISEPTTKKTVAFTADIDISASDYTGWINLVEIGAPAGLSIAEAVLDIDLAKATTGFAAGHTTQTIQFAIARKVDATNWRVLLGPNTVTATVTGTLAAGAGMRLELGEIRKGDEVRVYVKLSAEVADVELPCELQYRGGTPIITAVAAG